MKRPYVPLKVRLAVLERQAFRDRIFENEAERDWAREWYELCCCKYSMRGKVRWLLHVLFHGEETQLDHDPALVLRKFNLRTGRFIPDANSARYLVYRVAEDHLQKTTGRTPGAERTVTSKGSDVWLAKKYRKINGPKKSTAKMSSRSFSKGKRRLVSRSSFATRAGKDF